MTDPANPPAFPQSCADALDVGMIHEGMTLRDWFAGQIATACGPIAYPRSDYNFGQRDLFCRERAREIYRMADAMLAERSSK